MPICNAWSYFSQRSLLISSTASIESVDTPSSLWRERNRRDGKGTKPMLESPMRAVCASSLVRSCASLGLLLVPQRQHLLDVVNEWWQLKATVILQRRRTGIGVSCSKFNVPIQNLPQTHFSQDTASVHQPHCNSLEKNEPIFENHFLFSHSIDIFNTIRENRALETHTKKEVS